MGADRVSRARLRFDAPLAAVLICIYNSAIREQGGKFDWDEANTGHIALHDVTPEEVEQAFANNPLVVLAVQKRNAEERVLCAGLTDKGRPLQFVYTMRRGGIRVITAHTAKRKVREKL